MSDQAGMPPRDRSVAGGRPAPADGRRTPDAARQMSRSRLPLPPVPAAPARSAAPRPPAGPRTTMAPFAAVPSPEPRFELDLDDAFPAAGGRGSLDLSAGSAPAIARPSRARFEEPAQRAHVLMHHVECARRHFLPPQQVDQLRPAHRLTHPGEQHSQHKSLLARPWRELGPVTPQPERTQDLQTNPGTQRSGRLSQRLATPGIELTGGLSKSTTAERSRRPVREQLTKWISGTQTTHATPRPDPHRRHHPHNIAELWDLMERDSTLARGE